MVQAAVHAAVQAGRGRRQGGTRGTRTQFVVQRGVAHVGRPVAAPHLVELRPQQDRDVLLLVLDVVGVEAGAAGHLEVADFHARRLLGRGNGSLHVDRGRRGVREGWRTKAQRSMAANPHTTTERVAGESGRLAARAHTHLQLGGARRHARLQVLALTALERLGCLGHFSHVADARFLGRQNSSSPSVRDVPPDCLGDARVAIRSGPLLRCLPSWEGGALCVWGGC